MHNNILNELKNLSGLFFGHVWIASFSPYLLNKSDSTKSQILSSYLQSLSRVLILLKKIRKVLRGLNLSSSELQPPSSFELQKNQCH